MTPAPTPIAATLSRVQDAGERRIYRIERRDAGLLHLYRGDELVDVDRENGGDCRDDIEQWGAVVAWSEDHTCIERWDSTVAGDDWRTLVGIPYRYVTWQIHDEGVTAWAEIDSSNWVTRHIEATTSGHIYTTAASLKDVIAARETGGAEAVRAYEAIYGVVPEAPLPPDAEPTPTPVNAYEFVRRWLVARDELRANQRST
jgi:hypothetical protein